MKLDNLFRRLTLAASLCLAPASGVGAQTPTGGLGSGYPAQPHDKMLTEIARTALPVIAALDRFRAETGSYPPPERFADVRPYLPAGVTLLYAGGHFAELKTGPGIREWVYERAMPEVDGYSLSSKLGWDPDLVYQRAGQDVRWLFRPGDGSDDRVLDLAP